MSNELQGEKIAILAADGVEKVELEQPRAALKDAGAQVELLSLKTGEIQARNHDLEPAGTFAVDGAVSRASVGDFDALVLPGGTVNPDKLRMDEAAVSFVRDFRRVRKAGRRNLSRTVDAARSRRGGRTDTDLLSEHPHGPAQRGRQRGGRRGRRRRQLDLQSLAEGPRGVLRDDRPAIRPGGRGLAGPAAKLLV